MAIEVKCKNKIFVRKETPFIQKHCEANSLKIEFGNLIQYKTNPFKEVGMFDIPDEARKFNCICKKNGGLTNYVVEAIGEKGNVLNTFHYLV